MIMFNWKIINKSNYEITCDNLDKDIIIVDKTNNRHLTYFNYNDKKEIYTKFDDVHKVVAQINAINKTITIYNNITS